MSSRKYWDNNSIIHIHAQTSSVLIKRQTRFCYCTRLFYCKYCYLGKKVKHGWKQILLRLRKMRLEPPLSNFCNILCILWNIRGFYIYRENLLSIEYTLGLLNNNDISLWTYFASFSRVQNTILCVCILLSEINLIVIL